MVSMVARGFDGVRGEWSVKVKVRRIGAGLRVGHPDRLAGVAGSFGNKRI